MITVYSERMNSYQETTKREFAAFLRGMNVGGNRIKMKDLRMAFEEWGFGDVSTYLASGNVRFSEEEMDEDELSRSIHERIQKKFDLDIAVIVRSIEYLEALAKKAPFFGFTPEENTRFYVSLSAVPFNSSIEVPYLSPDGNLDIPLLTEREIFSVVRLSEKYGTLDAMAFIEKEFGSDITTRNWNTVEKILGI